MFYFKKGIVMDRVKVLHFELSENIEVKLKISEQ